MLKLQPLPMLLQDIYWLEGFCVMLRFDRFTCQQTFLVHRYLNLQRYMLGVKMCITAIPQQSIHTADFLMSVSFEPESVCLFII